MDDTSILSIFVAPSQLFCHLDRCTNTTCLHSTLGTIEGVARLMFLILNVINVQMSIFIHIINLY